MIKVGVRAHDVGKMHEKELSESIKALGFDGVQLVFSKAINHSIDFSDLKDIKQAFQDDIMMLGAYFNPVHPNHVEVEKGIENFKKHLEIAQSLNTRYVGTETGSLMGSPWGYVKENHDLETLNSVCHVFKDLVKHAEKSGSILTIEGAYAHVAYSPKKVKYLLDELQSPSVKVIVDLYNFLHIGNYQQRNEIFLEAIHLLSKDIVIFHLKDFIVENGTLKQVGLGQGLMDYPWMISTIKKHFKDVFLIFEGVVGEDIKTSLTLIKSLLERE
jgi:sugar phosphate isomerase/epimerase